MAPTLGDVGERAAIDALRSILDTRENLLDHDDDCAAVPLGDDRLLVATTDTTARRTHYPDAATAEDVGWYAGAVTVSDVAAMGAAPIGVLAALGLPDTTPVGDLEGIARGLQACLDEAGAEVLGGDTKEQPDLAVTTSGLGTVTDGELLARRAAEPGHRIGVTGALGGAAAQLEAHRDGRLDRPERLMRPPVRVDEGRALARAGARAAIDLSDGLAAALHQLADAAGVGLRVDADAVPVDPTAEAHAPERARTLALSGGGDFELVAAVPPDRVDEAEAALEAAGADLTWIGEVREGPDRVLAEGDGTEPLPRAGWEHFRGQAGGDPANL